MPKVSGVFNAKANWLTTIPQQDVAGHEVTVVEISGVHKSEDPSWNNAKVAYWGVGDTIAGNGTQRGSYVTQHADGDSDRGYFEARVITDGGKTTMEGTWTITGGTGKLNGAAGGGNFRSRMLSASEVECTWEGAYQAAESSRGAAH